MLEQIREMMELQEQLEVRISGPDWRTLNHSYALCIHMECAEIIDHIGWKHWKDVNKASNMNAIAMEVVDVWHFAMAFMLTHDTTSEELTDIIASAIKELKGKQMNVIDAALGLGYAALAKSQISFGNFIVLMEYCNMTMDDLYTFYISKNVLNRFRQDNGYKEGLYLKNWAGKEDNEHLLELTLALQDEGSFTAEALENQLKLRYHLVTVN